jgi:hypothetical protein
LTQPRYGPPDEYYGERIFHGTPFRRAVEEGVRRAARARPGRLRRRMSTAVGDGPGQGTAILAANVAFECLALAALARSAS